MRSALTFRNSHAIERKPECACQVVDFSSVFCWSGGALAGAPEFIDGDRPDFRSHLSEQTLGFDHVFEFAGSIRVFETAYRITRRGGTTTTAGLPPPQATFGLPVVNLVGEKRTIKGSYIGPACPPGICRCYVALYRAGRLPVQRLMSGRLTLEQIN